VRKCSSTVRFRNISGPLLQADPGISLLLFFLHVRVAENITNACKGTHTLHSLIRWHTCGGDSPWCAWNVNLISIQISKEPSYFSLALNSIVKHTLFTEEVNYSPWKVVTILFVIAKLDLIVRFMYRSWRRLPADENKAAHILFSDPLSEPGSGYIWAASECNLYHFLFIYMGIVFSMGFQSATFISFVWGFRVQSLYSTYLWCNRRAWRILLSYVTCIYQANAVNIHSRFCEVEEANQGSEEAGSWCSQRQKESRERSELWSP